MEKKATKKASAKKVTPAKKAAPKKAAVKKADVKKVAPAKKTSSKASTPAKKTAVKKATVANKALSKMLTLIEKAKKKGEKSVVVYTTSREDHNEGTTGGFGFQDLKDKLKDAYKHLICKFDLRTNLVNASEKKVEWIVDL